MQRRLAPWFGGFLLVLVAAFLAVFGRGAIADPGTAALVSGLVAAAVLSIVGGTVESVTVGPWTLPWNVLLVAIVVVLSSVRSLGTGGTDARLFALAAIAGGASLAWLGLQTARNSRHVDLESVPSRRRIVGIAALALASSGVGVLVAMIV